MRDRLFEEFDLTNHAQLRNQQRGISPLALSLVLRFGKRKRTRDGFSYAMDRKGRLRAKEALGTEADIQVLDKLDFYIVVARDGESVITAAPRLRRHRNN